MHAFQHSFALSLKTILKQIQQKSTELKDTK